MSLCHSCAHADACPASSAAQPVAAARWDAEIAEGSGVGDVSAVSTPTNFVNAYAVPRRASKVISRLTVRFCAALVGGADLGSTVVLRVDATAPSVPVAVRNATSIVDEFGTAPPPVWVTRRAPAPSTM